MPENSRRRWGSRVSPGTYLVTLKVGDTTQRQEMVVRGDPDHPEIVLWGETYDEQLEIEEMFGEEEYDDAPWWQGRQF